MINFHIHGDLGQRFGECFRLEARDPAECIRALATQIPEFAKAVREGSWHVVRGDKRTGEGLDEEGLHVGANNSDVHLVPAVEGAGGDGVFQTIVGVALIAASFIPSPASPFLFNAGVALTAGGVAQMLTNTPGSNYDSREKPDERSSFIFNGATNTSTQGIAVPVGYGRMLIGSVVVSAGMSVEELD